MTDPMNNSNPQARKRRSRDVTQQYWEGADAAQLKYFVNEVTAAGCACLFARTRDGGSLVVQVFNGEEKLKEYLNSPQEAAEVLNWLLDDIGCLVYSVPLKAVK